MNQRGASTVIERRVQSTQFREVRGSNGRQRWATAVTYNIADDYGTLWLPKCLNQGFEERMPTILYGHDWYEIGHVLGRGIDYRDSATGVDVLMEFADPKAVPNAGLAMSLTAPPNPVLKDVSIGFDRKEWLTREKLSPAQLEAGATEVMIRAVCDEISIVIRGAVPGAQMRDKRSRSWVIDGKVSRTDPYAGNEVVAMRTRQKRELAELDRQAEEALRYIDAVRATSPRSRHRPHLPYGFGR